MGRAAHDDGTDNFRIEPRETSFCFWFGMKVPPQCTPPPPPPLVLQGSPTLLSSQPCNATPPPDLCEAGLHPPQAVPWGCSSPPKLNILDESLTSTPAMAAYA